jgi:hypothetical protein
LFFGSPWVAYRAWKIAIDPADTFSFTLFRFAIDFDVMGAFCAHVFEPLNVAYPEA